MKIEIKSDGHQLDKIQDCEYVLVSDTNNISVTFSQPQQAFWFETSSYIDNTTYGEIFNKIYIILNEDNESLIAKRIGMRFVNKFQCGSKNDIKKILKHDKSKIIIEMLNDDSLSRVIAYKEYNKDGNKGRVQYGVINKFYPAVISTFDITLDIDVYVDSQIQLNEWISKIGELNHEAYSYFESMINEKFMESLK